MWEDIYSLLGGRTSIASTVFYGGVQPKGPLHGSTPGIMYDLMHLSHENQEKLEEMLEHIIELDDLKNGWVKSDFSMTLKALEEDWSMGGDFFGRNLPWEVPFCTGETAVTQWLWSIPRMIWCTE